MLWMKSWHSTLLVRPGREWNGWIDDIRIYNYALSEGEIEAIFEGRDPSRN